MRIFQLHVALLGRVSFQFHVGLLPVWVVRGVLVKPGGILLVAVVGGVLLGSWVGLWEAVEVSPEVLPGGRPVMLHGLLVGGHVSQPSG